MGSPLLDKLREGASSTPEDSSADPKREEFATRQIGRAPSPSMPSETRHIGSHPQPDVSGKQPASVDMPPLRVEGQLVEDTILQNRYRVLGVVGAGGMSTVYKAQDMHFPRVQRICAIKEMINTATTDKVREMVMRNFEREASILATLNHRVITQVYDFFTHDDRAYLVLEFVQGRDLESVLDDTEGFLSEEQVVNWAIQVCDVLTYLHNHKPNPVIFRDIKPANLMLDDRGHIRLVDFGIAKVFQSGKKGTMIGTEGYSPPEQYRGVAEPRGDVYALGATMHHLLSKQDPRLEPPFSFHERPIHRMNPTVSAELQEIINRALEYDANRRFGSAEEMKRSLAGLRSARGVMPSATFVGGSSGTHMALWQFACEDEIRSSPIVQKGVLYVGAYDNNIYALDAETGEFKWKYAADGGIASSPHVAEDKVFFGSEDHVLYAVRAETGRLVWTCPTKGRIYSSPQAQFGHVFVGSDDHLLYAVNIASGRIAWRFEAEAKIRCRPAVGSDAIYFGDEGGSLYSVGVNGKLTWRFRSRRSIMSSPALTDELILFGSQDWHVYALDLRSGWSIWRYRTNGPIISSPAVLGKTVFIGSSDGEVYALDVSNGYIVWRFKTGDQVASSPAVSEEAVYVGSVDGYLYSLDARTGQLRWKFQTNGSVISSPFVEGDVVYIGSVDHNVYALPT